MTETGNPSRPRVVFLHGVKRHKKRKKWLGPLNDSLTELGLEVIKRGDAPNVRYRQYLRRRKDKQSARRNHHKAPATAKQTYRERQDDLARILQSHGAKKSTSQLTQVPQPIRKKAAWGVRKAVPKFRDAENYRGRRERVCSQVLKQLGPGEFIVIGYSLGSVVAADLLTRLGPEQHIRLLVTLGSPLGAGDWSRTWNRLKPFPFDAIDAWVNVYNPHDHVTGGVGLSRRTRQVIDVPTKPFGPKPRSPGFIRIKGQHGIRRYMAHPAVAAAIAWATENAPAAD